jgi:hypothetical protein
MLFGLGLLLCRDALSTSSTFANFTSRGRGGKHESSEGTVHAINVGPL